MKYYVVLKHNNPKPAADYTVEDFKALTAANPEKDGPKNITLTMIKSEADAIAAAQAKSTEDSAFVVFAVTANGHKVKGGKINAHHVTFDSAVHVEPKQVQVDLGEVALAVLKAQSKEEADKAAEELAANKSKVIEPTIRPAIELAKAAQERAKAKEAKAATDKVATDKVATDKVATDKVAAEEPKKPSKLAAILKAPINGAKAIGSAAFRLVNAVKNVTFRLVSAVKNAASRLFNAVKSVASRAFNAVKNAASRSFNAVKSVVSRAFNAVKNTASRLFNAVKSVVSRAFNAVKNTASRLFNAVKSVVSRAFNAVKNAPSRLSNAAKSKYAPELKLGLKLALLVTVGAAALAFSGILPVAGSAAQVALAAAITAGTMVVAEAAVRVASALINAIKNRFGSKTEEKTAGKSVNSEMSNDNIIPMPESKSILHSYNTRSKRPQSEQSADVREIAEKKAALKA